MSATPTYRTASGRTAYADMAHDAKRELFFTKARLRLAERELEAVPQWVRAMCLWIGRMVRLTQTA